MAQPIYIADAFTAEPFRGNPAAVCPMQEAPADTWMQSVAAEMNLSETAFCWPEDDHLRLRWFMPEGEADLCGHATLATAHVLWETGRLATDKPAVFETKGGRLTCSRDGDYILMNFPEQPAVPVPEPAGLREAVHSQIREVLASERDYLIVLPTEEDVRHASPDLRALRNDFDRKCFIITSTTKNDDVDFVSRFFAPGYGIDEDPVTGSAHCTLAPYWGELLKKDALVAHQISPRHGELILRRLGNGRLEILGRAVMVLRGELVE